MIVDELKKSILQQVFQGNLSEQLKSDSDVDIILNKITEIKNNNIKKKAFKKTPIGKEITAEDVKYNIPNSWRWVRFIDLCSVMTCGYASTPQYVKNGMPFLSAKNVKPYEFKPQEYKMISKELYEKLTSTCKPERNDILLTRVGAGIGECAIIDVSMDFAIYVSLTLIKLVDYELISNKYILYWLNSPYGISNSVNNITGKDSSQGNLNVDDVRNFLISFPPIEEQRRIVDKIEELFSKLDEIKPIEDELEILKLNFIEDMRKSIVFSALSGKLTKQFENEKLINYLEKIKIRDVEINTPFDIPSNWKWVYFGDIVNFKIGKTPPRADSSYWSDGRYNWISIADMNDGGCVNDTKEMVSQKAFENVFKGNITPKGTLIMSFKMSLGKCSILNIDSFHHEGIISIFPKFESDIIKEYLFKALPFLVKYGDSKNAIKGKTLNSQSLDKLLIPLPPIEEQQRIVEKLERLLPLCADIERIVDYD